LKLGLECVVSRDVVAVQHVQSAGKLRVWKEEEWTETAEFCERPAAGAGAPAKRRRKLGD